MTHQMNHGVNISFVYDFESMQDGTGEHIPNLVVAHFMCEKCQDLTHVKLTSTCSSCGSHCPLCDKLNEKGNNFDGPPCLGCDKREVIF